MGPEVGFLKQQSNLTLKRAFRSLWIARINAGARELGIPYSKLINGLTKKDIAIDRKILSDLAINDSSTFEKIVQTAIK